MSWPSRFPTVDFTLDWQTLVAYGFGLVLLYLLARLLFVPMKWALPIIVNSFVGIAFILIFNLVGGLFDLRLALNPITVLIAGFLGLPGVGLLLALEYVVQST